MCAGGALQEEFDRDADLVQLLNSGTTSRRNLPGQRGFSYLPAPASASWIGDDIGSFPPGRAASPASR
jgi:hypothetical protein